MASTTTLALGVLIDETLDHLLRVTERPSRLVVGSNALSSTSDTQLTLSLGEANITDVMEFQAELLLVTDKSAAADPVYTVARGYLGTTAVSQPTSTPGSLNPQFPRYQIARAIQQGVGALSTWLPRISTEEYQRVTDRRWVELPEDTIQVLRVQNVNSTTYRIQDVGGWDFIEDLPTSMASTTKVLKVASAWDNDDDLLVTRQVPYEWTGADELGTVDLPITSDDLLPLYAAARLSTGREISRLEVDKVEEWNREAAIRGGVNLRMVRDMWTDFYRRLDEVRRQQRVPRSRPFRRMHTSTRSN